jgi:hypothetical protein
VAVGTSFPLDATEEVHSLPELANTGNEDEVWDTDSEDVLCENFDRLMAKAAVTEERKTSVQGSSDRIYGCCFRFHHHVVAEQTFEDRPRSCCDVCNGPTNTAVLRFV